MQSLAELTAKQIGNGGRALVPSALSKQSNEHKKA
jgi:hypothetical protein